MYGGQQGQIPPKHNKSQNTSTKQEIQHRKHHVNRKRWGTCSQQGPSLIYWRQLSNEKQMKEGFWGLNYWLLKYKSISYKSITESSLMKGFFLCKHAEQQKRLQFQREWQTPNGRQSEVTSIHLTSELNAPPALFPRAQLSNVDVSELRDNSLFLYSRLTAPVDFNLTLHQSRRPDPERLSAASGETTEWLRRLTRGIGEPRPRSFPPYFWTNASPNVNKTLDLELPVQCVNVSNPSVIKPRLWRENIFEWRND